MKISSKYLIRLLAGLLGYAIGLAAMNALFDAQSPHRYYTILLPLLPLLYTAATVIRAVSEFDEMHRKIAAEAMAFSALATGFSCFGYLFLRDAGAPEFHAEWAFYLMWLYYGIGSIFSSRRYL
jgi:hypothetical protein